MVSPLERRFTQRRERVRTVKMTVAKTNAIFMLALSRLAWLRLVCGDSSSLVSKTSGSRTMEYQSLKNL